MAMCKIQCLSPSLSLPPLPPTHLLYAVVLDYIFDI